MNNKTLKTFAALLVLSLVSILICQFSTASQWNVPNKRWAWLKTRVFSPRQDIDYVVIGSSYAWSAFIPNLISKKMNRAAVWSLARNWDGREVDYIVVKELLKRHNVKNILVQFYNVEVERIHPFALYVISPADAFAEMLYYFKNTPIIAKEKVKERINTIVSYFANLSVRAYLQIFSGSEVLTPDYKNTSNLLNGFYVLDERARHHAEEFTQFADHTWEFRPGDKKCLPPGSRAGFYLERIWQLCREYKVNLYFVFVPHYLRPLPSESIVDYLSRMGEVLIPDIRVVNDIKLWRNPTHLFQAGSRRYTRELIPLLQRGKEASPFYKYYKK